MDRAQELVRTDARSLDPREILTRPVSVLMGVSPEATSVLAPLGIVTVFDLAASSLFHAAQDLGRTVGGTPSSLARHGQVPGDVVDDSVRGRDPESLALSTIDVLREITPSLRKVMENALHVTSVRDLGLWPPYRAARVILSAAYGDADEEGSVDPEAPADLVPVNGRYPTERVQYATLILDGPLTKSMVETIDLQKNGQINLPDLEDHLGYVAPAIGALLTFQQSWYAKGLTLGNLIHSVALAPGESTRIAMVDWSRRTRTGTMEDIQENEVLQEDLGRVRALTEITSAVAKETQSGQSAAQTLASAWQHGTADGSASTGITWDSGPHPGVRTHGESTGESRNSGFATSWSTSSGSRDIAATLQQNIADRTQQAAHSTRSRRASIVREASQQESETLTTRAVTNFNHMHALTVQYYEVVQQFRTVIELTSAERVLFVPLKPLAFSDPEVVDRYREVLAAAALGSTAREQLTYPRGTTRLVSPMITGSNLYSPSPPVSPPPPAAGATGATTSQPPPGIPAKPSQWLAEDRWMAANIAEAQEATGGLVRVLEDGRLVLPSDAVLWDVDFLADDGGIKPTDLRLGGTDGSTTIIHYAEHGWDLSSSRLRLEEIASVHLSAQGVTGRGSIGFVSCIFSFRSRGFKVVFPVRLAPDQSMQVLSASSVARELAAHLQQNRLHYSRAIWSSIDDSTLGILLSRFTIPVKGRDVALVELVDPTPVGLVGNLLAFRAPGLAEDDALEKKYRRDPREDHIPVPSGGVFAEAVLGRFNSAERLDITRFWDWADSPIPIQAPDISPLFSGSRGIEEDLKPGQLSSPVLNIVNPPGLPDPSGMSGILAAIQNGAMFRDMSGLAGTIGLAQAGVAAAQQGAQAAAEQAGLNAEVAAELGGKVADIVGKLIAAWTTGGLGAAGAGASGGGGGVINSPKGMSKSGSLLNYAREMDSRSVDSPLEEAVDLSQMPTSTGGSATGANWEAGAAQSALGLSGGGPPGAMGLFARWIAQAAMGVGFPFKGTVVDKLLEAAAEYGLPLTRPAAEAMAEAMSKEQMWKLKEKPPLAEQLTILKDVTLKAISETKDPKIKKELQDLMVAVEKKMKPKP